MDTQWLQPIPKTRGGGIRWKEGEGKKVELGCIHISKPCINYEYLDELLYKTMKVISQIPQKR